MRVAVFGGAGAMGRIVARELAASPIFSEVVLAGVDGNRAQQVYGAMARPKNVRVQQVDMKDRARLQALLQDVDLVANCAFCTANEALMTAAIAARISYADLGGLYRMTRRQPRHHERANGLGSLPCLALARVQGSPMS